MSMNSTFFHAMFRLNRRRKKEEMWPKLEDITFALKIVCNQIKKRRIDTREEKLPKIDNITFAPKMYSGRLREE